MLGPKCNAWLRAAGMGRRKKKAAGPDTPKRKKMEKQLQLDVIMREAAAIVLAEIRKMKDADQR